MERHCNICNRIKLRATLVIATLLLTLNTLGQSIGAYPVTLNLNNAPIKTLFSRIQQQTGLNFIYNSEEITGMPDITISTNNEPVESVLNR
ncbi:MAG: hypothetical protein J6Q57_01025, partial [Paraprevotella sp.]|nr:hypothetical protein [Paraprevotella sp.]